jgi:hypothetical protein
MLAATMLLEDIRMTISSATSDGDPLETIERDVIDPAPLSEEDKSGLWLFAWSEAGLGRSRQPPNGRAALLARG